MAEYIIRSPQEIKGCDGCPCQNYNPIMRVPFCNLALETLTEEYAKQKPKWCPLIEVPLHGDLIERDKLPQNHITDYNLEGHSVVDLEDVQNAPTIIEAST